MTTPTASQKLTTDLSALVSEVESLGTGLESVGAGAEAQNYANEANTSATNASQSATAAANSASAASTSAGQASTSATNASSSASAASLSATNASNSASAASTSAGNASTSATTAGQSATTASQQATAAGTSATNASNSASAASASAAAAANYATAAAQPALNRAINDLCLIAQRPTVTAGSVYTYGGPDHFIAANSGVGAFTQSQGSITLSNGTVLPTVKQTVTTAAAAAAFTTNAYWAGIQQIIEGQDAFDMVGNPIPMQFLFYTNVTGTYSAALLDNAATNSCVITFNAQAGVPVLIQLIFPANASLVIPNSNAAGLYVIVGALSGSSTVASATGSWAKGNYQVASNATQWSAAVGNFISLTQLKVESGNMNTPYQRRKAPDYLLEAQRYYEILQGVIGSGGTNGTTSGYVGFQFKPKRLTSPTFAISAVAGFQAFIPGAGNITPTALSATVNAGGASGTVALTLSNSNVAADSPIFLYGTSGTIAVNAEF